MTIKGLGAVYFDGTEETQFRLGPDYVERFAPEAFQAWIDDGNDVLGLFNHDLNLLLGRRSAGTLKLNNKPKGLFYEIFDDAGTQLFKDVQGNQRAGNLVGSSVGFKAIDERFTREGNTIVRTIHAAALRDLGPVTIPAYQGTEGGEVRSTSFDGICMPLPQQAELELRSSPGYRNILRDMIRARIRLIDLDDID